MVPLKIIIERLIALTASRIEVVIPMVMPSCLDIRNLTIQAGPRPIVRSLSFQLSSGSCLGLMGASGSGKSLTAKALLGLLPPGLTLAPETHIQLDEHILTPGSEGTWRSLRGHTMGFIPQHPAEALNPVRTIESQMREIYQFHAITESKEQQSTALKQRVRSFGFTDPERILRAYPHELSGGMAQRVVLAMSLLLNPRFLIADEPTTGLDLPLQSSFIQSLNQARTSMELGILFISHDFALIWDLCDQVLVLWRGELMEQGPPRLLYHDPKHPYTRLMMRSYRGQHSSLPRSTARAQSGCPYAPYCPDALSMCQEERPILRVNHERAVACHRADL